MPLFGRDARICAIQNLLELYQPVENPALRTIRSNLASFCRVWLLVELDELPTLRFRCFEDKDGGLGGHANVTFAGATPSDPCNDEEASILLTVFENLSIQ